MVYLHEDKKRFMEAINIVVHSNGMAFEVIEKDYYVTLLLRELSERLPYIVFKGGTSLSKCYKVIRRFSEDIDIAIDTSISQGQKKKLKKILVEVTAELGLKILNLEETRSRRDYNRYEIAYETTYTPYEMVLHPTILLETSYIALSFPTVQMEVHSYIGDMMVEEAPEYVERYGVQPFVMKVQGIDRTLVDKVFAVCDYYLQGQVKKHSRYIYDICKLLPLVPQDNEFHILMEEVRSVRKMSGISPSAQDGVDIATVLQEIVDEEVYRSDYQNITEKLLEEQVGYDTAIEALKEIQKILRQH